MNEASEKEMTPIPERSVPDHVPDTLVVDIDIYHLEGGSEDPHKPWLAFVAAGKGPLVWSPYNGGHWVATVPADIAQFQADTDNFSSNPVSIPDRGSAGLIPLETDPPLHGDYRRNILPWFKGAALKNLEPTIRALAIELIEGFKDQGECDFLNDFALRYPVYIVLQLLGLPTEDGFELNRLTDIVARHPDPAMKFQAYGQMTDYLDGWIQKRIDKPEDDGITKITQAKVQGRPYTRGEMVSAVTMLTLGGVDSVAMHLSFIALYLARNPEQQVYIRENLDNPSALNRIIDEFARRFPIANIFRKVTRDVEHNGVLMRAGDMISVAAPINNFNEELFPNGTEIDFSRKSASKHLSFGIGAHSCAGASLARTEVAFFLQEWFKRIPSFELKSDSPVRLRASTMSAVDELWLQWKVEK